MTNVVVTTIEASTTSTASSVDTTQKIEQMLPIRMVSRVVRGFGRGSTDLGIPTANLQREGLKMCTAPSPDDPVNGSSPPTFQDLPCGIYWGFCRIGGSSDQGTAGVVYKAALSIGYNPTYGNDEKTVEPHLIAPATDPRRHTSSCGETILHDFYDQPVRLSVVGYLRPELPFEGLEKLIVAIKNDIVAAEKMGDATDSVTLQECDWVESEEVIQV
jgi:riboflavin kinase